MTKFSNYLAFIVIAALFAISNSALAEDGEEKKGGIISGGYVPLGYIIRGDDGQMYAVMPLSEMNDAGPIRQSGLVDKLASTSRIDLSDFDPTNKNSELRRQGRNFDRERLKSMSRTPRPGRDYTKVYLRNRSSKTIWAAIRYVPFEWSDGTTSELKSVNSSPFETRAWFRLSPGQRKHIANTKNIYFYVYAKNSSGKQWSGDKYRTVYDNGQPRRVGFKTFYINAPYAEEHNINFGN